MICSVNLLLNRYDKYIFWKELMLMINIYYILIILNKFIST